MIGSRMMRGSRWLLLATLVASAWLWGSTRVWTIEVIRWCLLADTLLFLLALVAVRRLPRISPVAALGIVVLLLQGWWMVWNALPSSLSQNIPLMQRHFATLPASVCRQESCEAMLLITGLLGAFSITSDLSSNRLWRMRLWYTLGLTGVSIVALGLVQRLTNAPAIFWNIYENTGETFFAVFRYHANAGAYLNLMLPLIAGLAVLSVIEKWNEAARVFWISSALVTVAAVFVNVSRGATLVTGCIVTIGVLWLAMIGFISHRRNWKTIVSSILVAIAAASLLIVSFGTERLTGRWEKLGISDPRRILTYQVITSDILPKTGYFGNGPGTFESVFAATVKELHRPVYGRWDKAHNDHLQAIMEWGWIGYSAWALLFLGALWKGMLMTARKNSSTSRTLGICGTLALMSVLLHAFVDFPLQIVSIELCAGVIVGMLWSIEREQSRGSAMKSKENGLIDKKTRLAS